MVTRSSLAPLLALAVSTGCPSGDTSPASAPDAAVCVDEDLRNDPLNCGYCGNECAATDLCEAFACIPDPDITKESAPVEIAHDSTHVYWLNFGRVDALGNYRPGSVARMRLDGSSREFVVADIVRPASLLVDEQNIFWIEDHSALWRAPKSDPTAKVEIVIDTPRVWDLVQNASHLYVTVYDSVGVMVIDKSDWTQQFVDLSAQTSFQPNELVADDDYLYWNENDDEDPDASFWRLPADGGGPAERMGNAVFHYSSLDWQVDANYLYHSPESPAVIKRYPLAGGDPMNVLLIDGYALRSYLVTDVGIYASLSDCQLVKAPLDPDVHEVLPTEACALELAHQGDTVYWVNGMRVKMWTP